MKLTPRLLILILFLSMALANLELRGNTFSNQCGHLTTECSFYECVEDELTCGKRGYPLGFALKYCQRFENFAYRFSDAGKEWIQKTRECLTETFAKFDQPNSCSFVKKASFKSHILCYVESGYCDLSRDDKRAVNRVVWPSLWRRSAITTGLKIKSICRQRK
ncbi:MAG: hypothetical protein HN353_10005 [Bdellovibrionales bacterium]|jgi:hypothetical protein|nr:hypothetical protein [Bdellovibrionales bacterium]MBT3527233.1 hypothetical protein [Bdellovibrionales bacterium]MBT7668684.1 hypothetical protein [Bdellovibrionales bacterium]MBT7768321.1 hypothetical protein [Bdellovibrionales bacterium]